MKKTNILYWVFTGLFSLAMLSSGLQNIFVTQAWIDIFAHLGYPEYLLPFLGIVKVLGAIAILIPGFYRLKEWAYAGFFFDLIGATYSVIMTDGLQPQMAGMLIFFGLFALSYIYHRKREASPTSRGTAASASAVTA